MLMFFLTNNRCFSGGIVLGISVKVAESVEFQQRFRVLSIATGVIIYQFLPSDGFFEISL